MKPKLFFVTTQGDAPWGGSEELWSQSALRLKKTGFNISACLGSWANEPPHAKQLRINRISIDYKPSMQSSLIYWGLYKVLHIDKMLLLKNHPTLVIISQGGNRDGLDWMNSCRQLRIPYAAIVHANSELWWPTDIQAESLREAYLNAEKVFFVSKNNLDLLEKQLSVSLPNSLLIYNPLKVHSDVVLPWPSTDQGWRMAMVARSEPSAKGHDLLFDCLSRPYWQEQPLQINIYGNGLMHNNVKWMHQHLNLKNVNLRGFCSDIMSLWRENHALVLPSRYEGTPIALLEAMSLGRPALVTSVGGNTEWCQDGVTGYVCPGTSADMLDQTLQCAWADRNNWKNLGLAAFAFVKKNFSSDPIGDFCNHLLKLINHPAL